jgi:hypothetical protein
MMKLRNASDVISKTLSQNDTGQSGAHQDGILVPKETEILSFFPALDSSEKNPRVHLQFIDDDNHPWIFAFIYYNNRFFGGTRNEYRLTRMAGFIKSNDLVAGDELIFGKDDDETRYISYRRAIKKPAFRDGTLRLSNNWKVISISSRSK